MISEVYTYSTKYLVDVNDFPAPGVITVEKDNYKIGLVDEKYFILYRTVKKPNGKVSYEPLNLKTSLVPCIEVEDRDGRKSFEPVDLVSMSEEESKGLDLEFRIKTYYDQGFEFGMGGEKEYVFYRNEPVMPVKIFNYLKGLADRYFLHTTRKAHKRIGPFMLGLNGFNGGDLFYDIGDFSLPIQVMGEITEKNAQCGSEIVSYVFYGEKIIMPVMVYDLLHKRLSHYYRKEVLKEPDDKPKKSKTDIKLKKKVKELREFLK
jgi:hypothetical protein